MALCSRNCEQRDLNWRHDTVRFEKKRSRINFSFSHPPAYSSWIQKRTIAYWLRDSLLFDFKLPNLLRSTDPYVMFKTNNFSDKTQTMEFQLFTSNNGKFEMRHVRFIGRPVIHFGNLAWETWRERWKYFFSPSKIAQ